MLNNSQVRKLGEAIRSQGEAISSDCLHSLEQYRVEHKGTLSSTYQRVCAMAYKINEGAIATYRIKRIEAILSKLWRFPDMQLDRMGDVAGCRCILNTTKQVYAIRDAIRAAIPVAREKDYVKEPERTGYRSVHLYVKSPETKKTVEIQLRTRQQHNWATLVEISDLLFDLRMKEGISDSPLIRLHYLLSNNDTLPVSAKREIFRLLRRFAYFERLSGAFTANYLHVRKQWVDVDPDPKHWYFLIEAQSGAPPVVDSFSSFERAEGEYFRRFSLGSSANRVLAYLPKASFKKLSLAYSNYMLTYHQFVDDCFNILESLIVQDIRDRKFRRFYLDYGYYLHLSRTHIANIQKEITGVRTSTANEKSRRFKEWVGDIENELRDRSEKTTNLVHTMQRVQPADWFSTVILGALFRSLQRRYGFLVAD